MDANSNNKENPTVEKIRILIVEDESILALNIQKLLVGLGYEVCGIAGAGDRAVELAKQHKPDLILMDIHLRGVKDGIQVAEQIHKFLEVPVVYTTAYSDDETIQRAKKTNPSAFLLKPFEIKDLQVTIELCYHKFNADFKIREQEKWALTVLKNIGNAIVTLDECNLVNYVNVAAELLTGWSSPEALGQPVEKVVPLSLDGESGSVYSPPPNTVTGNGGHKVETFFKTRCGRVVPVEMTISDLIEERGRTVGRVLILKDISTTRKVDGKKQKIQEKIIRSQKMELLGQFAVGVAHDFNTFLYLIQGYAELQLRENASSKTSSYQIRKIVQVVKKADQLTQNLLLFSRDRPTRREMVPLNESVRGMMTIVKCVISPHIRVSLDLNPEELFIEADPIQIDQLLMNLVLNAKDAMLSIGNLVIQTKKMFLDKAPPDLNLPTIPDHYVRLSVSDTGKGMDDKKLYYVHESILSNRTDGNGLGLWIVDRILKNHRGALQIDSIPEKGSTFHCYFPLSQPILKKNGGSKMDQKISLNARRKTTLAAR